jgi:hypothetical protein
MDIYPLEMHSNFYCEQVLQDCNLYNDSFWEINLKKKVNQGKK